MPPSPSPSPSRFAGTVRCGFTLIELMVALAIVAIVAAIAVPSYQSHMIRIRRTAATSALLQTAQFMEQNMTLNHCYNFTTPAECARQEGSSMTLPAHLSRAPTEGTASYRIDFSADSLDAMRYTLQAVPLPKGIQSGDPCGTLLLTHSGARGAQNSLTSGMVARCWGG